MYRAQLPQRGVIFILITILLIVGACVPQPKLTPMFSHQGRLLDENGDPVDDGAYDVEYGIYQVEIGGTPVYTDTQSLTVQNGLFTTSLGLTDIISPTIFAQPTWLEISIEGETLTPRQELQGSPYAFSLISGAVVQGVETITRDYEGLQNTGASLTIVNSDSSATGGNGILAINQAAAAGTDRDNVAAIQARAIGGNTGSGTGSYGAIITSAAYRALFVDGGTGSPAAVFIGDIDVSGTCIGCAMAYYALNGGDTVIQPGDFVAVLGVELDADLNIPVMRVRRATGPGDAIIGVAAGAATRSAVGEVNGVRTGGFDTTGGAAAAGGHLSVVVQGLAQARAADAALQPGASLTAGPDGAVAADGAAAYTRALSAVDADGLVWVMLSGQ